MKKNVKASKKVIAGSVLMAAFVAGAFASPVTTATNWMSSNDYDQITSTRDWSGVSFEKFLLSGNFSATSIDLVGAFKVGDIVIAPQYNGNIISDSDKTSDSKTITTTVDTNGVVSTKSTTDTFKNFADLYSNIVNKPAVLVGFGNIGVKAGVDLTFKDKDGTLKEDLTAQDNVTTTKVDANGNKVNNPSNLTKYDLGKVKDDTVKPYVEAGMDLKAGDWTIKPLVKFGVDINTKSNVAKKTVSPVDKEGNTTETSVNRTNATYGLLPQADVVAVLPAEKFINVFRVNYEGTFNIYDGKYKDAFGAEKKASTNFMTTTVTKIPAKTTDGGTSEQTAVTGYYTENSYMNNKGDLEYSIVVPFDDRLTVKSGLGVNLSFTNNKTSGNISETTRKTVAKDVYGRTTTTEYTQVTSGTSEDEFRMVVTPSYKVGFDYAAVPNKFIVRASASMTLPKLTYTETKTSNTGDVTTTNKVTDSYGTVTTNTKTVSNNTATTNTTTKASSWSGVSASMNAGFSWYLTENFIVDTAWNLNGNLLGSSLTAGATVKF